MKALSAALLLCAVSAPALAADGPRPTPAARVEALYELRGAGYLAERARLLAETTPEVKADLRFTATSWRRDLLAEALVARARHPEQAARLRHLPNLDPEVYLMSRHGRPSASKDLDGLPAAMVLEELVFAGEAGHDPSGAKYPDYLEAGERRDLQDAEREAFVHGLILAAGHSGHPAAPFALRAVLLDARQRETSRAAAARALGFTERAEALETLQSILHDRRRPQSLREAAVVGIGGLPFEASLHELAQVAARHDDPLRPVALTALGRLGRVRGGDARLRAAVVAALVEALVQSPEHEVRVIEALSRTAYAPGARQLERIAADPERSEAVRARAAHAARRIRRVLHRRGL
jgi:hypothetical protein